ncbi:Ferredoxin--NADP(+) reductase [hydrothermal vent metagenome]|uniref:ferredoxin--NADP(+) reductase n=1 Tax=hydrothermal vent metagenome TaxID=652676 RepID=A0A3B0ZBI3_9ZZZZ
MTTWLHGKVIEKKQWCVDLYSLKIKTTPLQFKAGQFVNIGLQVDGKVLARPYSLINSPDDSVLEIHFNSVKNGKLSPLLTSLAIGDNVQVSDRASGFLTLNEVPKVDFLWLLATGTGIGPFLSMLKTPELWQDFKKIILCYSVKSFEKLVYRTDFDTFQSQHQNQFCFVPFITREKIDNTIHSRITTSLENGMLEKQVNLKLTSDSNHIMLCGNSNMIADVTALLENRGMSRHTRREPGNIAIEKYY